MGRESGCCRPKGCVLLSSDEVRDITVLSAGCCCCCVCVSVRANVFFRRAGDGRTDWRCSNAIDVERRIGAAILLPRFCKFRATELDGWMAFFFFKSVFDCFRPFFSNELLLKFVVNGNVSWNWCYWRLCEC